MSSEALVVFEIDRKSKNAKLVLLSWHKNLFPSNYRTVNCCPMCIYSNASLFKSSLRCLLHRMCGFLTTIMTVINKPYKACLVMDFLLDQFPNAIQISRL